MSRLEEIIRSPIDHSRLEKKSNGFLVDKIGNQFPIVDGVYDFVVKKDSFAQAEDHLAEVMSQEISEHTQKEWSQSKNHFWQTFLNNEKPLQGKVILYLGAGLDDACVSFQDKGVDFINVDIVQPLLLELKKKGGRNLVRADVTKLPFADESVDYVVMIDLLHHFVTRGIDRVLKEVNRVLKPGGKIYIEEINKYAFYRWPISILPLSVLNKLRNLKSKFKKNYHQPEEYEAPLSIREVLKELQLMMEMEYKIIPCLEYPETSKALLKIWKAINKLIPLSNKFGYHWFLIITKK